MTDAIKIYTDEAEWLESRKGKVTSSKAPMLVGAGYRGQGPFNLWQELMGFDDGEIHDVTLKRILAMGQAAEPVIAGWADDELAMTGQRFAHAKDRLVVQTKGLQAAPDGLVFEGSDDAFANIYNWIEPANMGLEIDELVASGEIKNVTSMSVPEDWEDEPSHYAVVQVHFTLAVLAEVGIDVKKSTVAASFGNGRHFRMYDVERNDALCESLLHRSRMMLDLVAKGEPPPDEWIDASAATSQALSQIYGKVKAGEVARLDVSEYWSNYTYAKGLIGTEKNPGQVTKDVGYGKNMIAQGTGEAKNAELYVGDEQVGKVSRWTVKAKEPCESCGKGGQKEGTRMRITAL